MCTIALNIIHGDIKDKEKLNSFMSHNKKKGHPQRIIRYLYRVASDL